MGIAIPAGLDRWRFRTMIERLCKNCDKLFPQFRSTQNLCDDCAYEHHKSLAVKQRRKAMSPRGKVTIQWLEVDRPKWIKNHPPNHEGYWECYLQISPSCRRWVDIAHLNIDHVKPRSTNPHKRHSQQNLKPSCKACNNLKGSKTIDWLKREYPHSLIARGSM